MKRLCLILVALGLLGSVATATEFGIQTAVQPMHWTYTMADTIAGTNNNRYDLTSWQGLVMIEFTSDKAGSLYWWNADSTEFANQEQYIAPRRTGGYCDSIPVINADSTSICDSCTIWFPFNAGEVVTITSRKEIDSMEVYNSDAAAATVRIIGQRR